jgi:hypothetical protein
MRFIAFSVAVENATSMAHTAVKIPARSMRRAFRSAASAPLAIRLTGGRVDRDAFSLVREFVGNANAEAAQAQLDLVKSGWGQTHFAWMGPSPDPSSRYYFRVHGPRVLIEYDVQEPLANGGGHVHAITRDPQNDYGTDWLAMHCTEGNPIPGHFGPPPNGPPPNGGAPNGPPPKHR